MSVSAVLMKLADLRHLLWALQIKVLCNGIVDTLGRVTFGGRVNHPFTAHPKVDPVTGEVISQTPPAQPAHQVMTCCWSLSLILAFGLTAGAGALCQGPAMRRTRSSGPGSGCAVMRF